MDPNTTVAVDILVRTTMGSAATDFNRGLQRMEADARAFVTRLNSIFGKIQGPNAPGGGVFAGVSNKRATAGLDPAMAKAQSDIAKMQSQRNKWESDYTKHVNTQAEKQFKSRTSYMQRGLSEFQRTLDQQKLAESRIGQRGGGVGGSIFAGVFGGNIAANAVQAVTSEMIQGGKAVLDYSSKLEQAKIGFTTMSGSAETAQKHLEDLQQFAAKTPFQFDELVDASQKLQGIGFKSNEILPILKDVGDALAAMGRLGDMPFAIKALSDIKAKGKLAGQEIIQLANAGIPIRDVLAKQLNITTAQLAEMSETGQISADMVFQALHKMSSERFGDAMVKQSHTFGGAMSNIHDALFISASKSFAPFYEQVSKLAQGLGDEVLAKGSDFQGVGTIMAKYIIQGVTIGLKSGISAIISMAFTELKNWVTNPKETLIGSIAEGIANGLVPAKGQAERSAVTNEQTLVKMRAGLALNDNKGEPWDLSKILSDKLTPEQNVAAIKEITDQIIKTSQAASNVPSLADQLKATQAIEQTKQLAEATRKLSLTRSENTFNVNRAQIGLRPEFTEQDRIGNARAMGAAQSQLIKAQIENQRKGFDDEIALNKDSAIKVGKIQLEKTSAIEKLNADLTVNELNTQREIADAERAIYTRRREAAISFKEIQIQTSRSAGERVQFEIQRGLALGTLGYQQAFEKRLAIENTGYNTELGLMRDQLQLQLQDQTRTSEERQNLIQQSFIDEEKLTLDHGRNIFEIRQQQLEREKSQLQEESSALQGSMKSNQDFVSATLNMLYGERATGAHAGGLAKNLFGAADKQIAALKSQQIDLLRARDEALGYDTKDSIIGRTEYKFDVEKMSPAQLSVYQGLKIRGAEIDAEIENLISVKDRLKPLFDEIRQTMKSFKATPEGVDEFQMSSLIKRQTGESRAMNQQIADQRQLITLVTDEDQKWTENIRLNAMVEAQRVTGIAHLQEQEDVYRKSIKGLEEYNAALAAGDAIAVAYVQNNAIKDRLNEEAGLRERLIELQDRQNNSGVINQLRVRVAAEQDILDIMDRETDAVVATNRAQLEISQQTVYSAAQANAAVATFMANQKGVTQIMADFKIGLLESGYDLIDRGLDKLMPKMGKFGDILKDLVSSFLKLGLNWAFRKLFGGEASGGGASRPGGGGGILDTILSGIGAGGGGGRASAGAMGGGVSGGTSGGLGILGMGQAPTMQGGANNPFAGLLSGVGGGQQVVPGGAPGVVSAGNIGGVLGQQAGGMASAAGSALGKGNALGKFLNSPAFAGAIAGLGIGVGIGGGQGLGGVIGGIGGAITGGALGVMAGGLMTGGMAGMTAFLAATPFAIIGAGLLIAAFFIGRKAREKREKKQVTQLFGDATQKIQQLIADVKAFKITGSEAYNAGVQIRDQFADSLSQLKSKHAKQFGQQKLGEINTMLATLKTEGDRSDRMRNIAKVTDEKLIPTFAVGGFTGMNYGGQLAVVHSHEAILRQQDIMALGGYNTLRDAGVRGMDMSGAPDRPKRGSGSGNSMPNIYVVGVFDEDTADAMFDKVSTLGVATKVKFAARSDLGGMVDEFGKKLSGR